MFPGNPSKEIIDVWSGKLGRIFGNSKRCWPRRVASCPFCPKELHPRYNSLIRVPDLADGPDQGPPFFIDWADTFFINFDVVYRYALSAGNHAIPAASRLLKCHLLVWGRALSLEIFRLKIPKYISRPEQCRVRR